MPDQEKSSSPILRAFVTLGEGLRAMLFLSPEPRRIGGDAVTLCLLFLFDTLVSLAFTWVSQGFAGSLNWAALPGLFVQLPFLLLAGWVAARRSLRGIEPLSFPALAFAVSPLLTVVSFVLAALGTHAPWVANLFPVIITWWLLILATAYVRLVGRGLMQSGAGLVWVAVSTATFLLPQQELLLPPAQEESAEPPHQPSIEREDAFHAQAELLEAGLEQLRPQRPGVEDLYFVGFAGNAGEDVFYKELQTIAPLMDARFDTAGRSLLLVNNPRTVTTLPIATATNLRHALRALGERINRDEDVVMLYLTSHGSRRFEFDVSFWPLALDDLTPATLKSMLDEAGIKWRVIVVSACYAGGYIGPLKDEQTLVMTAADATHTSFGCGAESDFTYFGRALFDEELRKTHSLPEAFDRARVSIRAREQAQGFQPSNPQIAMGSLMADKLARIAARLDQGQRGVVAAAPQPAQAVQ